MGNNQTTDLKVNKLKSFGVCFVILLSVCILANPMFAQNKKKIPITPSEMLKRTKDVPEILEWCKKKHLTVTGPDIFGTHHIFINNSLKHIIFCLKADLTTHVFIGIPWEAEEWRKYDKDFILLFSKKLNEESLQWKIYKDIVLYRGKILPPKELTEDPYWGEVVEVEVFTDDINDQWIVNKIKKLYNK